MDGSSALSIARDEPLLRAFLSGDPTACRTVERWSREVLLYHRFGFTREEREDIVQDAVSGVWQAAGRPGFALHRGLRALVRTVTLARAIDRVRRRRPSAPVHDDVPDPSETPEEHLDTQDEMRRLHAALATLDEPCRDIIRLHYFEDWPYARIAKREGRREATMRVRMFNCMRALRELLGPDVKSIRP